MIKKQLHSLCLFLLSALTVLFVGTAFAEGSVGYTPVINEVTVNADGTLSQNPVRLHQPKFRTWLNTPSDVVSSLDGVKKYADKQRYSFPMVVKIVYGGQSQTFKNLKPGETYEWSVGGKSGKFTTEDQMPRTLMAANCGGENDCVNNFRDMGGWKLIGTDKRMKYGKLFRSAAWDEYTGNWRKLCPMHSEFGIVTHLDIREGTTSNTYSPAMPDGDTSVKFYKIQIVNYPQHKGTSNAENVCDVLRLIGTPERLPLVFHCAGGKDRTGYIAMMVGALCGMYKNDILRDLYTTNFENLSPFTPEYSVYESELFDKPDGRDYSKYGSSLAGHVRAYLESMGLEYKYIEGITKSMTGETPDEVLARVNKVALSSQVEPPSNGEVQQDEEDVPQGGQEEQQGEQTEPAGPTYDNIQPQVSIFNGTKVTDSAVTGRGGDAVYKISEGGKDYYVHYFTKLGGSQTFKNDTGKQLSVRYLVVGGGGAGGDGWDVLGGGGGGGGGGVVGNTTTIDAGKTWSIYVGNGGSVTSGGVHILGKDARGVAGASAISNGTSQVASAPGGGSGACVGNGIVGNEGAAGGGGSGRNEGSQAKGRNGLFASSIDGVAQNLNPGGHGYFRTDSSASSGCGAGGGGGAGGAGGVGAKAASGNGGAGLESSITGAKVVYGGGGGGGGSRSGTTPGLGVNGGNGGSAGGDAQSGADGTGCGGGGGYPKETGGDKSGSAGAGGSGIVIIRYAADGSSDPGQEVEPDQPGQQEEEQDGGDTPVVSIFNGTKVTDSAVTGRGGDAVYKISEGGKDYYVHYFTKLGGSQTFKNDTGKQLSVRYLVVGGGGAGGDGWGGYGGGGGGGGGGVVGNTTTIDAGKTWSIYVGNGGSVTSGGEHIKGSDSRGVAGASAITNGTSQIVLVPGGGAGACVSKDNLTAKPGAAGGGGSGRNNKDMSTGRDGTFASTLNGVDGSVYHGGHGYCKATDDEKIGGAGGGGGAGGNGANGQATVSGNGGKGITSNITGKDIVFGGGGGGAGCSVATPGNGCNGAGTGASSDTAALSGLDGTGCGGGGGYIKSDSSSLPGTSGAGGSGIVIIRYAADGSSDPGQEVEPDQPGQQEEEEEQGGGASDFDPNLKHENPTIDQNAYNWYDLKYFLDNGLYEGLVFSGTSDRLPSDVTGSNVAGGENKSSLAGVKLKFKCGGGNAVLMWCPAEKSRYQLPYMSPTPCSGLDYYAIRDLNDIEKEGEFKAWAYMTTARPNFNDRETIVLIDMSSADAIINLPLYNGLASFKLGLKKGTSAPVKASEHASRITKPVVFYGGSAVQGIGAARPGMAYVNIVGRELDVPVANLGLMNGGRMESVMATTVASVDASCYVLDCLAEMTQTEVEERFESFITRLHNDHPKTPIVIVEAYDPYGSATRTAKEAIAYSLYETYKAKGWNLVYLSKSKLSNGDGEGMTSGYLNPLGHRAMADALDDVLETTLSITRRSHKRAAFKDLTEGVDPNWTRDNGEKTMPAFNWSTAKANSTVEDSIRWIDGKYMPTEGLGFPDSKVKRHYDRLPAAVVNNTSEVGGARVLQRDTSAEQFRFTTNSKHLKIRWKPYDNEMYLFQMSAVGNSGVDVYRFDTTANRWVFKASGGTSAQEETVISMDWTPGEACIVNLPLYNGIGKIEIGIDEGATVNVIGHNNGVYKPVVFYGTSITQGNSASRPGLAFVNRIGRDLDVPVIDLGFSGAGLAEMPLSYACADIDASCYVIDCLWNLRSVDHVNKEIDPFVRKLRENKPYVPIVIAGFAYYGSIGLDDYETALYNLYLKLKDEGWTGLYYLPKIYMYPPYYRDSTVDGTHPTDEGMESMAQVYGATICKALGISPAQNPLVIGDDDPGEDDPGQDDPPSGDEWTFENRKYNLKKDTGTVLDAEANWSAGSTADYAIFRVYDSKKGDTAKDLTLSADWTVPEFDFGYSSGYSYTGALALGDYTLSCTKEFNVMTGNVARLTSGTIALTDAAAAHVGWNAGSMALGGNSALILDGSDAAFVSTSTSYTQVGCYPGPDCRIEVLNGARFESALGLGYAREKGGTWNNVFLASGKGTFVDVSSNSTYIGMYGWDPGVRTWNNSLILTDGAEMIARTIYIGGGDAKDSSNNVFEVSNGATFNMVGDNRTVFVSRNGAVGNMMKIVNTTVNAEKDEARGRSGFEIYFEANKNGTLYVGGTNTSVLLGRTQNFPATSKLVFDVTGPQINGNAMMTAVNYEFDSGSSLYITSSADLSGVPSFEVKVLTTYSNKLNAIPDGVIEIDPAFAGKFEIVTDDEKSLIVRYTNGEPTPQGEGWEAAQKAGDNATAVSVWGSAVPEALAGVNAKKLAAWATAKKVAFASAATIKAEAFLLNCANTDAAVEKAKDEFRFKSIVPGEIPSIEGDFNGTVTIKGSTDLENWKPAEKMDSFYKAVLEY